MELTPTRRQRVGRRVTRWFANSGALFGFGVLALFHGLRFLEVGAPMLRPPQGLEFLVDVFPLWFYGALWAFSGVVCLSAIRFRILTWWGLGCIIGMTGMWWVFYFGGYFYALVHWNSSPIYYLAGFYFAVWLALVGELCRLWLEDKNDAVR